MIGDWPDIASCSMCVVFFLNKQKQKKKEKTTIGDPGRNFSSYQRHQQRKSAKNIKNVVISLSI